MKKIDLSFLKHKELPTKDITIEINGESQTITIKPINGRGITSLGLTTESDVDRSSKMCLLALMYGLEISQNEAEMFMNAETVAADAIAAEVLKLTSEYQMELVNAKREIKKNTKTRATK